MIALASFDHADMAEEKNQLNMAAEGAIHTIRGQRVMLDSDLANIYGVMTKRLLEQVKRNQERFPEDFAFQLTREELAALRSQIATLKKAGRGQHRKYMPWVFTEHGALMLGNVLNSPTAVEASIRVVRAFVKLREMVQSSTTLAAKLSELERRLDGHDEAVTHLFEAIRQLLEPPDDGGRKREIGFHVRDGETDSGASRTADE